MYIFTVNYLTECDLLDGNIYLHMAEEKMVFQIHPIPIQYQTYVTPEFKYS